MRVILILLSVIVAFFVCVFIKLLVFVLCQHDLTEKHIVFYCVNNLC